MILLKQLLHAQLLMFLYSVRRQMQSIERLGYKRLFRWFVDMEMDDAVWVPTVCSKNRERWIEGKARPRMWRLIIAIEARVC